MRQIVGVICFWGRSIGRSCSLGGAVVGISGGFLAGAISLACKHIPGIGAIAFVKWFSVYQLEIIMVTAIVSCLIYGPYEMYKELEQTTKLTIDELRSQIDSHKKTRLEEYDRVLLDCADRLKRGETFLQALQGSRADERLETSDELAVLISTLEKHGHTSPFGHGGELDILVKANHLSILREMRLKGVSHDRRQIYEWMVKSLLEAEMRNPSPFGENESTEDDAELLAELRLDNPEIAQLGERSRAATG